MPRKAATEGSGTEPSTMLRSQHAEATRRAVLAAARASFGKKGYAQTPIDQIVAVVNAYLDVALDEEIRRITLIDGPALLGLEPDGPADQQAGHQDVRLFIATAIAHGQLIDLDPDLL